MEEVLFLALVFWAICSILQMSFWSITLAPLFYSKQKNAPPNEGVSVVICAKNAGIALLQNAPYWLKQQYPIWEIIIVDDHSTDNTAEVLKTLQPEKRVQIFSLNPSKEINGKKQAQAFGISKAKHPWILVTDADCKPLSNQWIQTMMEARQSKDQMVLGVGLIEGSTGLLNRFIRYESCITAIQYLTAAHWKIPYMGVGRNLLFSKSLYNQTQKKGFHLPYGDDDLFVNAVLRSSISYCLQKEGFTISPAKESWQSYYSQKTRHVSTGKYYRFIHKILLASWAFSHFFFWLGIAVLAASFPVWVLLISFLRLGVGYFIFNYWSFRLCNRDLRNWFIPLDFAFILYYIFLSPFIFWQNKANW